MKHIGTKDINTPRLLLRKFQKGDENSMFKNYCSDPLVTKYLTWNAHSSIATTIIFLEYMMDKYNKIDSYAWAITLKENPHNVVGSIDVVKMDLEKEEVEIGYVLSRSLRNKKIMSEALNGVIDYLFKEVEVKKIFAKHDINNINSGKVMKNNGMKYVGIENVAVSKNEENVICAIYSIENTYGI